MRRVSEAAEALLAGARSPLSEALGAQLVAVEGLPHWRATCEALVPARLHASLDELERHLHTKGEEVRRRQLHGGLASVQHAAQRLAHAGGAGSGATPPGKCTKRGRSASARSRCAASRAALR